MNRNKSEKYLGIYDFGNVEIVDAKDHYLISKDGKRYLDFVSGWCVGNIGWNVPEVNNAIKNFKGPNYVKPGYFYKPWLELAELLAKITPGKLTKSYAATGGTEAIELAMQIAMYTTRRNEFISIEGSYHGHSIGAMSIGSSDYRKTYKNLLPNCHKINIPLDEKAAQKVVELLKTKKIAAYISEPIICNLGVEIPAKEYYQIVEKACKKYGTLFIMDEVATGFGRTGKMFALEHYNLKPDVMCLAKGITGGYGVLGATIVTDEVAKRLEDFDFYSTFGWHPLNVCAAIANIKYLLKHKLWESSNETGEYFEKELAKISFKYPAKIRIKGLAVGIKFEKQGYSQEIVKRAKKLGCLLYNLENQYILLFPALNISKKEIDKCVKIIKKSV